MKRSFAIVLTLVFLLTLGFANVASAAAPAKKAPTKSQFTYKLAAKAYNGKKQGVTVKPKSGVGKVKAVYYTGTSGTKYKKSTTKPKNIGSYKVTINVAAGTKYASVKNLAIGTFKINPKKLSAPKTAMVAKQLKVSWNKASSAQKVSGYQVRYREKGTSAWRKKSCKASASSTVLYDLMWGEAYQVQVRSYKTIGKTKLYSAWSGTATSAVYDF